MRQYKENMAILEILIFTFKVESQPFDINWTCVLFIKKESSNIFTRNNKLRK